MPSFTKPGRPKSIKAAMRSQRMSSDDPLSVAMAPEEGESPEARVARLAREEEEKRVSDEIDKMLENEAKEKRKSAKACSELQVLLLGPTGAGKTTFVRQLRLQYDLAGLYAERSAIRLVVLLNVIHSVRTLLSLLEGDTTLPVPGNPSSEPDNPFRPLSPGGREPNQPSEQESTYRRRIRLAPLLGLEAQLRESLGVIATGPTAPSLAAHALDRTDNDALGWRDAAPTAQPASSTAGKRSAERRREVRSRAASPVIGESEPLFAPGFADKLGAIAFGVGKESRRARAQGTSMAPLPSADGAFLAGPDDPIYLLAALQDEVRALWKEAVDRGLVAGEGPRANVAGGFELPDSAKYFLAELNRIARPEWLPSDDDLLNVRVRTLGIEQHLLQITPTQSYRICDVAGARGVKHSWAPFFEGASALIFITAVSDYNVCSVDDPKANRLADALELFEDVATNRLLEKVTLIIFLNKIDLLRRKIKSGIYPLETYFPTFAGGNKTKEILQFLQTQFEERHALRQRPSPLYCYATQANDTKSVKFIIAAINDVLMRGTLAASGLL